FEGSPDVVVLDFQARPRDLRTCAECLRLKLLCHLYKERQVPVSHSLGLACFQQLVGGVLPNCLQEPVTRAFTACCLLYLDKRFVDQVREEVKHIECVDSLAATHRFSSLETPAAHEDGEPPQQRALLLGEEVVAPVDGRL